MTSDAVGISPGRVNLIGEHTDYNDGFVLPIALDKVARVTASPGEGDLVTITSEQLGETVTLDTLEPGERAWWGYVAGVLWALRQAGHDVGGVELTLTSDVPLGGGLSSSAALECATALALDLYAELDLTPEELAQAAQTAENGFLGIPTGPMDQRASLWCETDHALLLDCRTLTTTQVPFALPDDLVLALVDTRSPHVLADGHYARRREACEAAAAALGVPALRDVTVAELDDALARLSDPEQVRRVRHVVTENARVLDAISALGDADWPAFGALLTASHASMRDDYEITVPTVDLAVEVALASGALGSRMTGGGFGGTVIALLPADRLEAFTAALQAAYAERGFDAPGVTTTRAAAGGIELSLRD
ncbi:galactokinase [Propioniciclava coleopterorum]|uniref:Galactokinase n=1 Tax=Propioniciclava coleopterorum TaxID=2714937 RepID=A0A6G7Y9L6_9ACTN|nr:galactokinase [Propioniciclava coleopterorum]QIK73307.1 galactokinase [Propioniciclava coleopterorum]